MKYTLIVLTVLAMAGCASVAGLREKKPDLDLTSNKTPIVVGQCIANGWGEFMGVSVNHASTPNGGYSVSLPNIYSGTNGVADISPTPTGSTVKVYYRAGDVFGHGKFTKVAERCI
ncbi:hypothetical protein [Rhodanobacter lindaniclasticus]|uniref:hypothetical protein n=1 Tax=Rhodanobacter lindaniclasticus TaxID=75310 RepID=UPI0010A09C36|nr:hypothetical protein [Rhodanobacter lindaniclasticus]